MNIFDGIKEVIEEINGCNDIGLESDLKVDLGLDSLSLVSVIVELENKFNIAFDDSDLDPGVILKVQDLVSLVEKTL